MADVTISSLPQGTPLGNGVIPFSLGDTTYQSPISAIFQNRIAFRAWNGTGQNLTSNQLMTFNVTGNTYPQYTFNVGNCFSNNRFTAPYTGMYHFSINVLINSGSGGGYWGVYLSINGTTPIDFCYANGTTQQSLNLSTTVKLISGDYVEVRGATNGISSMDNSGSFSGYFIG